MPRTGRPPTLKFKDRQRLDLKLEGETKRDAIANLGLTVCPDLSTYVRKALEELAAGRVPPFALPVERESL